MSTDPESPGSQPAPRQTGRALACVGCAAALVLSMLASILFVAIATRNGKLPQPLQSYSEIQKCRENLMELTAALQRYHIRNNTYPEKLQDLYPGFLNSDSYLWCPTDHSHTGGTSYQYTQPARNASPDTVVIRCFRHHPTPGAKTILEAQLDGNVNMDTEAEPSAPPAKPAKSSRPK